MNKIDRIDFKLTAPRVPKGTRVYAIGDIHGRADLLRQLLKTIAKDAQDKTAPRHKVLITLGDYIDRGPDSADVIERLSTLHRQAPFKGFELCFLKGNHEHLMERFLERHDDAQAWLGCGGIETLKSYGAKWSPPDGNVKMPKHHRKFLKNLALTHQQGDYLFTHAGLRPGTALHQQRPQDLLWIRAPFLDATGSFGAMVVHGHTPVDVPHVLNNRIAIDTRAWASGTLTALVLEGSKQRFLST